MGDALGDLVRDGGFQAGLVFGLLASVALGVGGAFARRARGLAGLAVVLAAVLGLAARSELTGGLVVGLVVLGLTGALAGGRRAGTLAIMALPGAWLVARSVPDDRPGWLGPTVVLVTALGGALVASFDRSVSRHVVGGGGGRPDRRRRLGGRLTDEGGFSPTPKHRGVAPVLLAVTAFGAYATTPETEHVVVLVGAALPVALLAWWGRAAALGATGSLLATALVAWTVAVDGAARPGAMVGGLACLGVLVLAPVVQRLQRRRRRGRLTGPTPTWTTATIVVVHVALVLACSRIAGLRGPAGSALLISALSHAAAAIGLLWTARRPTALSS